MIANPDDLPLLVGRKRAALHPQRIEDLHEGNTA
jgi:hypothetical protein